MPSSWKLLLHLLLLITSLQKAQLQNCILEDVSDNAAIIDNNIYCFKVPESSVLGSTTCVFRVRNADNIRFYNGYLVERYNRLDVLYTGNKTITASLIQTDSYSELLDTGNPPNSSTLFGELVCLMGETTVLAYPNIYVDVDEENTQTPSFLETSYSYFVPEIWPVGMNLAIEEFGPPIIAQDADNVFANVESPAADIIFELQGFEAQDFDVVTVKNFTRWPYTYRALLSSKKLFDYRVQILHPLILIARNADFKRQSTVNINLYVEDFDNLLPAFTSSSYSTKVYETMVTTPGTYPLTCNPKIHAYDQDTGINQAIIYSIYTDCGDTLYCHTVKTYFAINNITGALSFISNGEWPYQTTAFSFLISASQVDNPDKVVNAEVIATGSPTTVATTVTTTGH